MSDNIEMDQAMLNDYTDAMQQEFAEYLPEGSKYFRCGYKPIHVENSCFYNFNYYVALSLIGQLYSPDTKRMSNYKKGIVLVSENLELSRREVKTLRKKFKCGIREKAYVFITPYTCGKIINEIVNLLEAKKDEPAVQKFLDGKEGMLYRSVLLKDQYAAIKNSFVAASNNPHVVTRRSRKKSEKVEKTYTELTNIIKQI